MKPKLPDLAIMIGKVKGKGSKESEPDKDEGESTDKEGLAQDLIDAVKAGDAGAVLDAFEALAMACKEEY